MDIRKIPTPLLIVVTVVLLAVLLVAARFCSTAATIEVTVNGAPLTIHGAKTMGVAARESGLPINPGDFISLTGTLLKKSDGHPFSATVNGEEVTDPNYALHNGDVITLADGEDRVEDYDAVDETVPYSAAIGGAGAICKFEHGSDGITEVRTGRISGDVTRHTKLEQEDATCVYYTPDVGKDKVVALTFEEGPSEQYTSQILDILRDNDARATFFCVGVNVVGYPELVKRAHDEGNQICTNTYDRNWKIDERAKKDDPIDADGLVEEVEHGRQVISEALGEEASRVVRIPNQDLTEEMAAALDAHVDAEIDWNEDSGDWVEFNNDAVYESLMNVKPGDIVLLHDGGGDRSGTVEALGRALPLLKKRGYSFITIDELMEYPAL